jgi:hypothetical protein
MRRQSQFNARKKFQFAILCVRAMIRIQRLRYTPEPLNIDDALRDPYRVKVLRKVSDTAFLHYMCSKFSNHTGHRCVRVPSLWTLGQEG